MASEQALARNAKREAEKERRRHFKRWLKRHNAKVASRTEVEVNEATKER